jgi:AbrB family looped-hinge helix DNA binding protein
VVVTRKGQITIPADFQRVLGVRRGDRVALSLEGGQVRIRRTGSVVEATAGSLRNVQPPVTAEALREAAEQAIAEDVVKRLEE